MATAFPSDKFNVSDLVTQSEYLQTYGIRERLAQLLSANKGLHMHNITEKVISGANVLLDPAKMGSAYKVFTAISR